MHARHRSPGNGYRPNSMGMNLGVSRASPDSSARGRGFYNSEHRGFNNRGFGRGQGHPKAFQQPPQPPMRKSDILMEAGRLAAEYLVSKGMLPQSALSGKWQNGSFEKQVEDYQDFREQEDLANEGRISAHVRLGGAASDAGSGRRRYSDDFSSRNHMKGRRRGEYYRSYSSEWGREYGRSVLWPDRNRLSPDMDGEDDTLSGHYEEQQVSKDVGNGMQRPGSSELAPESEEAADVESELEKHSSPDEMGSKASSSGAGNDMADGEPSKGFDDLTSLDVGNGEVKGNNFNWETEKQKIPEDIPIQHGSVESDLSSKNVSDLLSLCNFAKVPTKTRSALTCRASKADQTLNNTKENSSDSGPPKVSDIIVQDSTLHVAAAEVLEDANHDSNHPDSKISEVEAILSTKDVTELGPKYDAGEGKCTRSQSFPDRAFMHDSELESVQGLVGFERSTSVKERGEKRAAEVRDMNDAAKKPRECLQSLGTADKHMHFSQLSENRVGLQEQMTLPDQQVIAQDSVVGVCQFPKMVGEPGVTYSQEKQLFPSSFKTCDLNLMEASDMNDNHRSDPVLMYSSIVTAQKEAAQVDVDLSISNSNMSGEYARISNIEKDIEVIDLENDSTPEDGTFGGSQRKMDATFTGTEVFSSHAQNAVHIPDVQDNYDGLMLSEYLNTFPNCTSVPEDINSLQNEMGLHNGEGTLGDDDSIYMSLEEIPLSFIPDWEQPTPKEYEKPF